ncbi:hypothetical protein GGI11_003500 [Coemansia sp. RSA 2049]|nr:hypothetical protein GGI11_003500 [Coemansia sp. RSA 2049]
MNISSSSSSRVTIDGVKYPYEKDGYTICCNRLCFLDQRVLCAFKVVGVPHSIIHINVYNPPSWYALVNPPLTTGVLRTPDGTILNDSMTIVDYVADSFPSANLMPHDTIGRAQLRMVVELFNSRLSPYIFRILMSGSVEAQRSNFVLLLSGAREANIHIVKQWQRPSGGGGPFWQGDRFAFAEIAVAPFLNLLVVLKHYRGMEIPRTEEYAAFNRWRSAVSKDPSFAEIRPADDDVIAAFGKLGI